jgi:vacuolar protein sorting-associated protein 45
VSFGGGGGGGWGERGGKGGKGSCRDARTTLTHAPSPPPLSLPLSREVVLSPVDDSFFRENLYSNFGDLAMSIKSLLDDYTRSHKMAENVSSIEDMQRFVDKYPELKSKGLAVGKHVALMSEMSTAVDQRGLMDVSVVEQDVAAGGDNPNDHFRDVTAALSEEKIDPIDALRLVMLYTLRYERSKPDKVAELRRCVCGG